MGCFFIPPRPRQSENAVNFAAPERHGYGIPLAELLDVIFGSPGEREVLSTRLNEYLGEILMRDLTTAHDALTLRAEDALTAVAIKQLARFEEWRLPWSSGVGGGT